MTFLLLAVFFAGGLVFAPFWMHYALKQDQERREWVMRRRARELRK